MRKFPALVLIICVCASCSVQKRHYRPGYYVSRTNSQEVQKKNKQEEPGSESLEKILQHESITGIAVKAAKPLTPPDSCDVILLQNGSEQKGKISQISETSIKYQSCENLQGPLYEIKREDVFMIQYASGKREILKKSAEQQAEVITVPRQSQKNKVKKMHAPGSVTSLLTSLFALFTPYFWALFFAPASFGFPIIMTVIALVFAMLAILTGNFALTQQRKFPDNLKGRGAAIAGLAIAWTVLSGFLIVIIIALGRTI